MGKEIESVAKHQNLIITNIFELSNPLTDSQNYEFDVAIDFSYPDSVLQNVRILSSLNKNIVIGTTGWLHHFEEISSIANENEIGLVYGSNFSIGMQMFFRIVAKASEMVNKADDYDVFMNEIHHLRKKDSPSGTALSLAKILLEQIDRKNKILDTKADGPIERDELHISSIRGGEISGTHTVYIDSLADTIELTHRAKNRTGFASGAVEAAKWINGRKGIYDFNDVISELWSVK